MDIPSLPFNRLIGLRPAEPDGGALLALPAAPELLNHLGTVHAGALMGLAEAASAECLLRRFGSSDGLVPVVRRFSAKFRRPAIGAVSARAEVDDEAIVRLRSDLESKGRGLISVAVSIVDQAGETAMTADVDWFVSRTPPEEA